MVCECVYAWEKRAWPGLAPEILVAWVAPWITLAPVIRPVMVARELAPGMTMKERQMAPRTASREALREAPWEASRGAPQEAPREAPRDDMARRRMAPGELMAWAESFVVAQYGVALHPNAAQWIMAPREDWSRCRMAPRDEMLWRRTTQ